MSEILAAPTPRDARARAIVGNLARASLAAVVVGGVLCWVGGDAWWPGFLAAGAGFVVAVGCLVHGRRHEHERGRGSAGLAAFVGFLVVVLAWYGYVSERCGAGARSVCLKSPPRTLDFH